MIIIITILTQQNMSFLLFGYLKVTSRFRCGYYVMFWMWNSLEKYTSV